MLEDKYQVMDKVFNAYYKGQIIALLNNPEIMEYLRFAEGVDHETDSYKLKIIMPRRLGYGAIIRDGINDINVPLRKIEEEL